MAKTHHHTMESRSKTKNSIKRLFFCLLAIFLQIAFFLSIVKRLNTQMPWINALTKILHKGEKIQNIRLQDYNRQ